MSLPLRQNAIVKKECTSKAIYFPFFHQTGCKATKNMQQLYSVKFKHTRSSTPHTFYKELFAFLLNKKIKEG